MIEYSVADGIARITLNRPEKRNALSVELISALKDDLARAGADSEVRVILLRGGGPDFCAGLDLKNLAQNNEVLDHLSGAQSLAAVYLAMRHNPKPVVVAVQGRAIGGGAGLATAADLLLLADNAELRYPEVNLGFIAAIVLSMLSRQVGEKRAFETIVLGEPVSARTAVELGIANHTFHATTFDADVEAYVAKLAGKSQSAVALSKKLLHHIDAMPFDASMQAGVYANAIARMTPDARRGFEAFLKKQS